MVDGTVIGYIEPFRAGGSDSDPMITGVVMDDGRPGATIVVLEVVTGSGPPGGASPIARLVARAKAKGGVRIAESGHKLGLPLKFGALTLTFGDGAPPSPQPPAAPVVLPPPEPPPALTLPPDGAPQQPEEDSV